MAAVEAGEDPLALGTRARPRAPRDGRDRRAPLGRVLAAGRTPEQIVEEAHAVLAARERAAKAIAVLLRERLTGIVMTHSASATVREALLHAPPRTASSARCRNRSAKAVRSSRSCWRRGSPWSW